MNWKFWQTKKEKENEEILTLNGLLEEMTRKYKLAEAENEEWIRKLVDEERYCKKLEFELKKERIRTTMEAQSDKS